MLEAVRRLRPVRLPHVSRPDAATPHKDQQQMSSTEPAPTVTSSNDTG